MFESLVPARKNRAQRFPTQTRTTTDGVGVIVAIVRDVLQRDAFTTDADVADAVKCRCARLRIPYDSARVNHALDIVASNRRLSSSPTPPPRRMRRLRFDDTPRLSRDDARAICDRLGLSWGPQ